MNTIKKGIDFDSSEEEIEVEREYETLHEYERVHAMDEDDNLEVPPPVDRNLDILQLPWRDEETEHEEEKTFEYHYMK